MVRSGKSNADIIAEFLLSDAVHEEAMLAGHLDGFLAGIVVCPDMIMPSQWIPEVWNHHSPEFKDQEHAEKVMGALMGRYNDIIYSLDIDHFNPVFHFDDHDGSPMWEFWIDGFVQAMELKPDCWDAYRNASNEEVKTALMSLEHLQRMNAFGPDYDEATQSKFDKNAMAMACDIILKATYTLHIERKRMAGASRPTSGAGFRPSMQPSLNPFFAANENTPRVGRNDPCPCGSGKKYKKCCLN